MHQLLLLVKQFPVNTASASPIYPQNQCFITSGHLLLLTEELLDKTCFRWHLLVEVVRARDLRLSTGRGKWNKAFQSVVQLLSTLQMPRNESPAALKALLCRSACQEFCWKKLFSVKGVIVQCSMGSGNGVYRLSDVVFGSLFPFIISLNIAEGSGMVGQRMALCLLKQ